MQTRGFTLIELLVVIAIIGILASVVLVSVNTARTRGEDAGLKSNMSGMRTQAEIYYGGTGANSYDGFCAASAANEGGQTAINALESLTGAASSIDAAGTATTITCNDSASGWAAEAPLSDPLGDLWCVDGEGFAGVYTGSTLDDGSDITCGP